MGVSTSELPQFNLKGRSLKIKYVHLGIGTISDDYLIVDVKKNGESIFVIPNYLGEPWANTLIPNGRPMIFPDEKSGQAIPLVTDWLPGEYLTISIDYVSSTVPGADLVVNVVYE